MTPLEAYLTSLLEIRSSGEAVDETSYYGALETFFNEVGKTLKPKVRCVLQLKNRGVAAPSLALPATLSSLTRSPAVSERR
jgi:hypothetical protein